MNLNLIEEMRCLKLSDKPAFEAYVADWRTDKSPYASPGFLDIFEKYGFENFEAYVNKLNGQQEKAVDPRDSAVTSYFAFKDNVILGQVNCRWQTEKEGMRTWRGFIGYSVAPRFRNQGIAEQMTKFALEKYRKKGILNVLITAREGNLASRRTIEKCGGKLENKVEMQRNPEDLMCRYWIDLKAGEL